MPIKWTNFWISLIIFNFFCAALSINKGYYTIVAPGTIQPESIFHISLTLNDFHSSCWFNISVSSFYKQNKLYEFESIKIEPRTTKLVELLAPSLNSTLLANLEVLGNCGVISKDIAVIHFESYHRYWAFIQTNKPKYRPGELVKFRVICIDQLTRPPKIDRNFTIQIYDDQHHLVKGFFDVKLVQGVFKSELQLSKYPVLGLWKIRVISSGIFEDKIFEVNKYVLPKFNVQINTNKTIAIVDEQIELEISASYFYGEPVKGNLSILMSNTDLPWHKWLPTPPSLFQEHQIDGKTTILINLKNDLQLEKEIDDQRPLSPFSAPITPYKFHIEAYVIDSLSGEKSWTTTEIEVNIQPHKIELQAPNVFDSSDEILNIKVKVEITDFQDNPIIQDTSTPIEIIVGCYEKIGRYICSYEDFDVVRFEYQNQIGRDFSVINIQNKNYTECYLYAEYQKVKSSTERMYKKIKSFAMDVLTENPEEGKELEIKISNPDPIEEFSYEIVSGGDIIQSNHVYVPGNQTSYILCINVTFLMVPKITIYAHHIKNMNFGGQLKDVVIKRALKNSIEVKTVNATNPGTSVFINVTTDEGSYVGLMALDRRALENIDEQSIFDENFVNTKLESFNSERAYDIPFYGRTADIITFSNVFPPGRENGPSGGDMPIILSRKRISKLFPESWLYNDFERTPAGGFIALETPPSDTITTWAITAFSLHPDTGLTFTKNQTNLKVLQDFFVSMDLPSSIKEGEIIEVSIYISNYMSQDALTQVIIETDSEDLVILEDPENIFDPKKNISKLISAKKREKIVVFLKPLKQGHYNVTVKAISSVASDAIQKTLSVLPQGILSAMSKTFLVHLTEESIQEDEITIDIPENAIPESQRVEVSVVGDIFRPLIDFLQKMSAIPYINGDENMELIVSNSIALKYLKALNYSDPSLESKMKLNLELGYQNQLSLKYKDGSFGLFERKSEITGDIWQTFFTLWGLKQVEDLIHVDPNVIRKGLDYLKSKQQANGCFKSDSGLEEDVKLTAFGLIVFSMDEYSRTAYSTVITKGLEFLNDASTNLEYTPISVVAAYVLFLGKHEKAEDLMRKSNSLLTTKNLVWTESDTLQSYLETTAESLMNLFESQKISEQISLLQIVRSLITSQNKKSYVHHMIALQAMLPFAEKLPMLRTNLKIRFKDDQNKTGDFRLSSENSKVVQSFELTSKSRKIKFQSRGCGFAMVNVKYKYNNLVPEKQSSPSFYSTNISIERYSNLFTYLKISTRPDTKSTQNKFIIMEVRLQSGFRFTEGDFNDIENHSEDIKSVQYNGSQNKAMIYVKYNPSNETCVELEVLKTHIILNSKPGCVVVYDKDDKDQKTTKSFHINGF